MLGLLGLVGLESGCKNRRRDKAGYIGELVPPKDAADWEARFAVAYDDSYTPTAINLQGRAPNDVLDQQLFASRLGHAALVLLVDVEQVWGKGRFQGRQSQFVEVTIAETLMGTLPKDTPEQIMIEVSSIDELPGSLKDEPMLLFLRWDLESDPPYHHHLMPADEELVALINAMVSHAKEEGVLDKQGEETGKGKKGRGKKGGGKQGKRGKQGKGGAARNDAESSAHELDAPTEGGVAAPPGGTTEPIGPDQPPPSPGPEPDASTGLQELGGETAPPSAADGVDAGAQLD